MPSIRQIASVCGFSKTTVAAVLANDVEVAPATRRKIQKVARAMGYQTDARVTELMSHLRNGRPSHSVCNLAWLNTHNEPNYWTRYNYLKVYLDGARNRSEELGYSLNEFWLGDPRLTITQLTRQLSARGIRGLILPDPEYCSILENIEYKNYSIVKLFESQPQIPSNRIAPHSINNMNIICRSLYELGYRRPTLMISEFIDMESGRALSSAFVRCQQKLFYHGVIPVPEDLDSIAGKGESIDWIRRWEPDAVIGHSHELFDRFQEAGFKIPDDFAYVHTHLGPDTPGWAGIDPHQESLAAAAVEAVVALIHRKETGLPDNPKVITLEGHWRDGWTAPLRGKVT